MEDSKKNWLSDGDIIWKARGDANDFANLYVSLSNSLGVPARRVHVVTEETDYSNILIADGPFVQYGTKPVYYDAAEVNVGERWQYRNPFLTTSVLPLNATIKDADAYNSSGEPVDRTSAYHTTVLSTQFPLP